jgi:hypothetical protein
MVALCILAKFTDVSEELLQDHRVSLPITYRSTVTYCLAPLKALSAVVEAAAGSSVPLQFCCF